MHSAGDGKYIINLEVYSIGRDELYVITSEKGGHIGAVTIVEKNCLQTVVKKGHKDDVVSKRAANLLYNSLGKDIAVICGIHIDNASKEEIEILLANVDKCIVKYMKENR